jgi:hypothetical protein
VTNLATWRVPPRSLRGIPGAARMTLATVAKLRERYDLPKLLTPAERHAAQEDERRRDRAAAGDAVLRFGTMW